MSVPASSAQIPTGHTHSVNRSGGVIALSHSDFSPNTRKREVVRENGLDSGLEAEAPREEERGRENE
ncbi:hypothetical protein BD560DRAFT_443634 [Blakeslea trispora]|nr:hypothetical protein BD560DRAFT_443634 [Blakeslea trispora]